MHHVSSAHATLTGTVRFGFMRIAFIVAALGLAGAAPAADAAGDFSVPAPAKGSPQVLSPGDSGASVLVWATYDIYEGFGPLTVDSIHSGRDRERTRKTLTDAELADSARDRAGHLDLLVARKPRRASSQPALALYRAVQDGKVRRVWSGGPGRVAAVARRDSAVAVAWIEQTATRSQIKLVMSREGSHFTRARTVSGVLPRFPRTGPVWSVNDLDLTLDAHHRPVLGVTISRRVNPVLVLAALTGRGRVRTRQVSNDVDGLVHLETTARGRVAVVVDDTGIEGERGECVGDPTGRRLFASTRERTSARFHVVQRLDKHPLDCGSGGAELETIGERVAVLWTRPGGARTIQGVLAEPGRSFATPTTLASGAVLQAATGWRGQLVFASTIPGADAYAGPLALQVINASGVNPREAISINAAGPVLLDRDPEDIDMLAAWQEPGSRTMQLKYFGGQ
jgi:hypothetical protein